MWICAHEEITHGDNRLNSLTAGVTGSNRFGKLKQCLLHGQVLFTTRPSPQPLAVPLQFMDIRIMASFSYFDSHSQSFFFFFIDKPQNVDWMWNCRFPWLLISQKRSWLFLISRCFNWSLLQQSGWCLGASLHKTLSLSTVSKKQLPLNSEHALW